jgi:hypothetical protein
MDNEEFKAQAMINQMKQSATPSVNALRPTFDKCPQCGVFHPPLAPGQICPKAPVNIEGITDQQINQMLVSLKNILVSQIRANKITDSNKLLQQLVLHTMKFFEEKKF